MALGLDPGAPGLPSAPSSADPRVALTELLHRALSNPPCVVSFSGGRDSSVVLALAVRVAREAGLPDPIPATLRFPGVANADERSWQEDVIGFLGVTEWERIELRAELDFLGLVARTGLTRHGLLWPPNAHFHVPIFERAVGGTVLTGYDGDGLFSGWRWERAQAALRGLTAREPRDAARFALAFLPPALRRPLMVRRTTTWADWLRPSARAQLLKALARDEAYEPRRWDRRLDYYVRTRFFRLAIHNLALLAADAGAAVVHPLAELEFLAALAATGGAAGFGDRTRATGELFGDLLPAALLNRRSKGEFGGAFWGPEARAFMSDWDGAGLDHDFVDIHRLRAVLADENPPLAAATLVQGAWLSAHRTG